MTKKKIIVFASFILLNLGLSVSAENSDVAAFIDEMVQDHRFDRTYLQQTLASASKQQNILKAMTGAAERSKPWYEYRKIFVTPKRIKGGVQFWQKNQAALARAQQEYGVAPEIIVAIIGVETYYGRITGSHRVLDALYTLAFYHPRRGPYFRKQLREFLLLAREEAVDPGTLKGSYAGAMGRAQFMPDSYRYYAVDFDGDGKRDIWNNDVDAIGSVANYFRKHLWQPGQPVTTRVGNVNQSHQPLVKAGMKPSLTIGQLREAGIQVASDYDDALATSLIELQNAAGKEYWAGLNNFYSITRYNHSNMYAMAVYQLAQAILEQR